MKGSDLTAEKLLGRELTWRNAAMVLFVLTTSFAVVKAFWPGEGEIAALLGLAHVATAAPLTIFVTLYTVHHFRRTAGIKRWGLLATGIAAALLMAVLVGSGVDLAVRGPTETRAGLAVAHRVMGLTAAVLLLLHVVMAAQRKGAAPRFAGYKQAFGAAAAVMAVLVITGISLDRGDPRRMAAAPRVDDYSYGYGEHPFRPSQTETVSGGFVHADHLAVSAQCGTCHQDIYQQWRESMHAHAASDPAYVTNIEFLTQNRGMEAARYCEGCHAPVALLSGQLSEGGFHGGTENTAAFHEGVGCLSCHGVTDVVHLKGVGAFMIDPDDGMALVAMPGGEAARRAMILANIDAHKEAMGRPIIKTAAFCSTCHEQFMDRDMNGWGWVKMQADYSAWLESPFSGQHDHAFAVPEAMPCQSCHMPKVAANDPSADANGMVFSHRFPGANTAIPHVLGYEEQEETVRAFLQAGRMRVSIDPVERSDAPEEAIIIDPELRRSTDAPALAYAGEDVELRISVTNIGVGHNFPGGTTDLNEAWLAITVRDASGAIVSESGAIGDDGYVDAGATFYKSVPIDRAGQEVWRHDLFNMVGEAYRRTIPSGESDVVDYAFGVPYWAKGPLTITASLNYRKLNKRYSEWALPGNPVLPVTEVARDIQTLEIKSRPAVLGGAQ